MEENIEELPLEEEDQEQKLINYMRDTETNEIIEVENVHQISMLNEINLGMTFSISLVLLMCVAVFHAAYSISKIGD